MLWPMLNMRAAASSWPISLTVARKPNRSSIIPTSTRTPEPMRKACNQAASRLPALFSKGNRMAARAAP